VNLGRAEGKVTREADRARQVVLKIARVAADDLNMESNPHEPIRLSDDETEMLTRALLDARDQAELPAAEETETQFIRRGEPGSKSKVGNTQQITREPGNMIF
jgi:hypothetical protein